MKKHACKLASIIIVRKSGKLGKEIRELGNFLKCVFSLSFTGISTGVSVCRNEGDLPEMASMKRVTDSPGKKLVTRSL